MIKIFVFIAISVGGSASFAETFGECLVRTDGGSVAADGVCKGLEGDPRNGASQPQAIAPAEDGGRAQCARSCANTCVQSEGRWNCPENENASNPRPEAGSKNTAPATPSPEELAQRCVDNNSDAVSSCTDSQNSADNMCNADKNAGMSGATDLAAAMALAMGQMTSGGVQAACGSMANISQGSNAALAAYRVSCNNSKNSCTSSCSSAKSKIDQCAKNSTNGSDVQKALAQLDDYKTLNSAASKCKALQTKVDQADQAIKNIATTQQNAANCQQATSALAAATPAQDCSNPTFAATNQVCICQANPRLPGCGASEPSAVGNQGLGSTTDFSSATGGAAGTALPSASNDNNLANFNAQKSAAEDVGGKHGAGAPINSASAFNGSGNGAARAAGTDYSKYGNAGFYGSGSQGGKVNSGGNRASKSANNASGFLGKEQRPDLRQFLPGGKADPTRGVAGTTGPDGITGPNTNIWEKVQNRYRNVTPSLL